MIVTTKIKKVSLIRKLICFNLLEEATGETEYNQSKTKSTYVPEDTS